MDRRSRLKRYGAGAIAVGVSVVLAACGGGGTSSGSSGSSSKAAGNAGVQEAAAAVSAARGIPAVTYNGDKVDASKARGKRIISVPLSNDIPFIQVIERTMADLSRQLGIKYSTIPNQGQPNQWVQGVNQAVAQHPDLILLEGAPDVRVLQPQLRAAKAAGIPVLQTHFYDESVQMPCGSKPTATCPAGVNAVVPGPFNRAAKLIADWIIADSKGNANIFVINSHDNAPLPGAIDTFKAELSKLCGNSCKTSEVNVPVPDWTTKISSEVQSALNRDPNINYIYAPVDAESQYAVSGVTAAGRAGKVKVATYNGTPFALNLVRTGNVLGVDVGENLDWLSYAAMDASLRILTGMNPDPVIQEKTALKLFDKTNVSEAGVPAKNSVGYGNAYVGAYKRIWGLK